MIAVYYAEMVLHNVLMIVQNFLKKLHYVMIELHYVIMILRQHMVSFESENYGADTDPEYFKGGNWVYKVYKKD